MKRFQINLEDRQYDLLAAMSNGRDMGRLIREALDKVYLQKNDKTEFRRVVNDVAGIWSDHKNLKISRKGRKRDEFINSVRGKK